jgi:hypothetical protein
MGCCPPDKCAAFDEIRLPNEWTYVLRAHLGQELRVDVLRLDPDTGDIFVSERRPAGRQLALPFDI